METYTRKDEECPKLLDLIQKDKEWVEDKKLELRLGPPDGDWNKKDSSKIMSRGDEFYLSFGYFPNPVSGNKRAFTHTVKNHVFSAPWSSCNGGESQEMSNASFLQLQQPSFKESSHNCCSTKGAAATVDLQTGEKKAFSPPAAAAANITAVSNSNTAQKRTAHAAAPAPAPVVGWPPVRSFRRNITTNSNLKPPNSASQNVVSNKNCNEKPVENSQKGLFVKINMDGVPIGRKVDLQVYHSYEKLSSAVDDLFRDLLAAQGDSSACGMKMKGEGEEERVICGLLDGSGEYTLVYEDNEGDRMLVGDVPWHMFISTVKRLRVLKTSEITSLCRGSKVKEELS